MSLLEEFSNYLDFIFTHFPKKMKGLSEIIKSSVKKLRPNSFAVVLVSNYRDKYCIIWSHMLQTPKPIVSVPMSQIASQLLKRQGVCSSTGLLSKHQKCGVPVTLFISESCNHIMSICSASTKEIQPRS